MAELPFPEPPLSDGVVLLRRWRGDDMAFVVAACQDPEVARFSPAIASPYSERDAIEWFASQEPERLSGRGIDLAICDVAAGAVLGVDGTGGAVLGAVGLSAVSWSRRSATIGYWLAREARGHGSTSRAVRLLASWAFSSLGLERIELTTDPDNVASQRVAERCGFTREGRLRSHMVILHSGERRDSLVYGLLPGELT
jgi:RimJ/RimL family protein N-acetyltransferase